MSEFKLNNLHVYTHNSPEDNVLPKLKTGDLNRLKRWANNIAAHYFSPVCLVGSACLNEDYRDVDIVVILQDGWFEMRYGSVKKWIEESESNDYTSVTWDCARDCSKKWERGCKVTKLKLDFKVIPLSYYVSGYSNMPIYRLDSCPYIK